MFQKPVIDLIESRHSCRSYDGLPLASELKEALRRSFDELTPGPFGGSVRLVLLDTAHDERDKPLKLGTYGVVKGAPAFIAGAIASAENDLEDFGYLFQRALLIATDLDLSTCWLGGTFKRDRFSEALGTTEDELVPAVSPVGQAAKRKTVVDTVFRFAVGSKKRKPWQSLFFDRELQPLHQDGPYRTPLEMIRLAPSASNNQPWRIVQDEDRLHLFLKRTLGYRKQFSVDLQRIDMGIAMCHFDLTVEATGVWQKDPVEGPAGTEYVATWSPS